MNLFKKWKNGMALCLLFALLLSSCGGAMPENTPPSAQTPEVQTPSLLSGEALPNDNSSATDKPDIQPKDPNEVVPALLTAAEDSLTSSWCTFSPNTEFLSWGYAKCFSANPTDYYVGVWDFIKKEGKPHVLYCQGPINGEWLYAQNPVLYCYYVIDDGTIMEIYSSDQFEFSKITIYNSPDEIERLNRHIP